MLFLPTAASNDHNRRALPTLKGYVQSGKTLQKIADELNASGFRTAKGHLFQRTQVHRLLKILLVDS